MTIEASNIRGLGIGEAAHLRPRQISEPGGAPEGKSLTQLKEELADFRDLQPMKTTCLFCDWTHIGLTGEARDAARAHREERHPAAAVRKARGRTVRLSKKGNRTANEEALIAVEAAESNRIRAEKEDAERLAKVLRAQARAA